MAGPTKPQLSKIFALKRALAWSEDDYRTVLGMRYGVESTKQLTADQTTGLIEHMEDAAIKAGTWKAMGKRRGAPKYSELGNRPKWMATPKQLRLLEGMWDQVTTAKMPSVKELALRSFIRRVTDKIDIVHLEKTDVQKLVRAMKAMGAEKRAA